MRRSMATERGGARQWRRGGAPGGAAPLARVHAPSHGARAARSQGLPKGASQAPGASRRSIPPLGGGEEGKQAHPGPSTTGAAERCLLASARRTCFSINFGSQRLKRRRNRRRVFVTRFEPLQRQGQASKLTGGM